MAKYITSDQVCEMFGITKVTLWRWEVKTQWGIPFPAPAHNLSTLYYMIHGGNALTRRELRNAHNAGADIMFTTSILEHITDVLGIKDIETLFEASEAARIPEIIPFGKHKGTRIKDLPGDYVAWLLRQDDLNPYVKIALEKKNAR